MADCSLHRTEGIIDNILKSLSEVKQYLVNKGFKNVEEEIHFSIIRNQLLFQIPMDIVIGSSWVNFVNSPL